MLDKIPQRLPIFKKNKCNLKYILYYIFDFFFHTFFNIYICFFSWNILLILDIKNSIMAGTENISTELNTNPDQSFDYIVIGGYFYFLKSFSANK